MSADFSAATVNAGIRQHVLHLLAAAPGASNKERIAAVARALRLPFPRVFDYKYNRITRIDAHEADKIRHYALIEKRARLARLEAQARVLHAELVAEAATLSETSEISMATLPNPPVAIGDRGLSEIEVSID